MRLVQLSPGTGNFHCGSCLRDRALVQALGEMGHDAWILPLYLPHQTDESDAQAIAEGPLFFGGINVYLQQKVGLFRHLPGWADRWLDHPALLRLAAGGAGMTSPGELGALTVSMLAGSHGRQANEIDRLIAWLRPERPEVVLLSNSMLSGVAGPLREALGCPVLCSLQGEDVFLDSLPEPWRERAWRQLATNCEQLAALIAPSRFHADLMGPRLGVGEARLRVIHNGIRVQEFPAPGPPPPCPTLGFLARLCADKGLDQLVDAFLALSADERLPRLLFQAAGTATTADRATVEHLRERLRQAGLGDRSLFLPNVSHRQKLDFLRELTVLSVPTAYDEAFGLYLLEAWASGAPVVQPRRGAFPELIEISGGGLLCEADDPASLADKLAEVLTDPDLRALLGDNGRDAVLRHFSLERMAGDVLQLCEQARQTS